MVRPVRVLLFASAREAVGRPTLLREIPEGGVEVAGFLADLARENPRLAPVVKVSRFVVNGRVLPSRQGRLVPGDELAIHPPYSGG